LIGNPSSTGSVSLSSCSTKPTTLNSLLGISQFVQDPKTLCQPTVSQSELHLKAKPHVTRTEDSNLQGKNDSLLQPLSDIRTLERPVAKSHLTPGQREVVSQFISSHSYVRQFVSDNKMVISRPSVSEKFSHSTVTSEVASTFDNMSQSIEGSQLQLGEAPTIDDMKIAKPKEGTVTHLQLPQPTRDPTLFSNSESRTRVNIYNTAAIPPKPTVAQTNLLDTTLSSTPPASLIQNLSRVPLCSSLLPQRQPNQSKPETKRERLVRRTLLERKYPLPSGVVIKSEPDDPELDSLQRAGYDLMSEVVSAPAPREKTPDLQEQNDYDPFESFEDNETYERLPFVSDQSQFSDEPPILIQQVSSSENFDVTDVDDFDDDDESAPPVLPLENFDDLHTLKSASEDNRDHCASPGSDSRVCSKQIESSCSVDDNDIAGLGAKSTNDSVADDSGISSITPSAQSSSMSVDQCPTIPKTMPTFQNPKIQHLKDLLEKKRKEIERIRLEK